MTRATFVCHSQPRQFAGESPSPELACDRSTDHRTVSFVPPFSMAQATETAAAPKAVKPVHVDRVHGITVSVFENHSTTDGKKVVYYKVAAQRTYRDGDEFKTTQSFSRDDLPVLSTLLLDAFRWIVAAEQHHGSDEAAE